LIDWFPEAQVVFVVREPRGVVGSLVAHDEPWANGSLVEHIRLWNAAADEAARWADHPNVHVLRYEDLAADPIPVLKDLWPAVLGHDLDVTWLPHGDGDRYASGSLRGGMIRSDRIDSWRVRLTEREAALVLRGCAGRMERFGYAVDDRPASALHFRWACAREDVGRALRAGRRPRQFARRLAYRRAT
jgi:hypothetical protein